MKIRVVSHIVMLLIISILIANLTPSFASNAETAYPPQPSDWAVSDIAEANKLGLVPEEAQLRWRENCTRLEFCQILARGILAMTGITISELAADKDAVTFSDCEDPDVLAASALDIVRGFGDGRFGPEQLITREQAAVMLTRAAEILSIQPAGEPLVFEDRELFSDWAVDGIRDVTRILCGSEKTPLMNGVGNNLFSPHTYYTVEQAAITVLRLTKANATPPAVSGQLYPLSAKVNGSYLWGYVDISGTFVIEPRYSYASEWNGEYGIVSTPEEPDKCFVIDREGNRISFAFPFDKEPVDTFNLVFNDGVPNVWFAGDFLITPEVLMVGYAQNSFFRLSKREYAFSSNFLSYSDGVLCTWYRDNASWLNTETGAEYSSYGQIGAFFDGVAVTWNGLVSKAGELIYEYNFSTREQQNEMKVYGLNNLVNWVGDSMVFIKPEWHKDLGWVNGSYGIVRADGTIILPAEYEYARLTPCKQILTARKGETYRLHDADGKEIYRFPTYMTGAFYYDESGYYLYRGIDDNLVVLSVAGEVTAKIPVGKDARHEFISGFVRITEADGRCRYYDVTGRLVFK